MKKCDWATRDAISEAYHDEEWGQITHDDQKIFEFLILETLQAGLSWGTVLKKRTALREAFDDFDYQKVAQYDETKFNLLINNPNIIRNQQKIRAIINNAKCFLKIREEFGSFDQYVWKFVDGKQIVNSWATVLEVPSKNALSKAIVEDLRTHGFKFLGSVIVHSFLQAIGVIDDHLADCPQKTFNVAKENLISEQ